MLTPLLLVYMLLLEELDVDVGATGDALFRPFLCLSCRGLTLPSHLPHLDGNVMKGRLPSEIDESKVLSPLFGG